MLMPLGNGSVDVDKCARLSSFIIVMVVIYLNDISKKKNGSESESSLLLQLSIIDWMSDYISEL